jgi:hypothetical protein
VKKAARDVAATAATNRPQPDALGRRTCEGRNSVRSAGSSKRGAPRNAKRPHASSRLVSPGSNAAYLFWSLRWSRTGRALKSDFFSGHLSQFECGRQAPAMSNASLFRPELIGGTGALWVRAKEQAGTVRLTATHPWLGSQMVEIVATNASVEMV